MLTDITESAASPIPRSLQDFAVTEIIAKFKDTAQYLQFFKIFADFGQDVSCDIITTQPMPPSIHVHQT